MEDGATDVSLTTNLHCVGIFSLCKTCFSKQTAEKYPHVFFHTDLRQARNQFGTWDTRRGDEFSERGLDFLNYVL